MAFRIAVVGGPLNEPMNRWLRDRGNELVISPDGPTAQRRVLAMLGAGERIDLLCAPVGHIASLARHLVPLEGRVEIEGLAVRTAGICTWDGHLFGLPRSIELRLLWIRRDQVVEAPTNWDELAEGGATFGFAGRGAELFHTFLEAYLAAGGTVLDADGRPSYATTRAAATIAALVRLRRERGPADLVSWRSDDVANALAAGRISMAQFGTRGWRRIRRSPIAHLFEPHPPLRGVSYGAGQAWAVPESCTDVDGSLAVLRELTGPEANTVDARAGLLPARLHVVDDVDRLDAIDALRVDLLRQAATGLVAPPPHPNLVAFEESAWKVLNRALVGDLRPGDAAAGLQQAARRAFG